MHIVIKSHGTKIIMFCGMVVSWRGFGLVFWSVVSWIDLVLCGIVWYCGVGSCRVVWYCGLVTCCIACDRGLVSCRVMWYCLVVLCRVVVFVVSLTVPVVLCFGVGVVACGDFSKLLCSGVLLYIVSFIFVCCRFWCCVVFHILLLLHAYSRDKIK